MIRNNKMLYNKDNKLYNVFNRNISGQILSFIDDDNIDTILRLIQWKVRDINETLNTFKFFYKFEDIGLIQGQETLDSIFANMQENSILLVRVNSTYGNQNNVTAGYPTKYGTLIVFNSLIATESPYKGTNQFAIWCDTTTNRYVYFASYNGVGSQFIGFSSYFEIEKPYTLDPAFTEDSYVYLTRTGNTVKCRGVLRNASTLNANTPVKAITVNDSEKNTQKSLGVASCTSNGQQLAVIISGNEISVNPFTQINGNEYIYINIDWRV